MQRKHQKAIDAASPRSDSGFWIDHAAICESDFEWLENTQRLMLWNVQVPAGFLARLTKLWWLDVRGGTGFDLAACRGAMALEYLEVNQVRGMQDLSVVAELESLRYLSLYGLSKVTGLPSCASLKRLERASLGQMRGLTSIDGLLDAPNLRELEFQKMVGLSPPDIERIRSHPSIERFGWFAEDVPTTVWQPVVKQIALPSVSLSEWPEDWFASRGRGSGRTGSHPPRVPTE